MITIEVIGMNHYMLSDFSRMHTKKLASLFETNEGEIFFYCGDSKFFHEGVDQTSWHTFMRVHAPHKYHELQDVIAKYLLKALTDYILNAHIEFVYFEEEHCYEKLNKDYPQFLPEDEYEEEEDYDDEDEDFSDEELFEGNAFEGFEEKLKEQNKSKNQEVKMCECGHQHECCDGKSAGCGKICGCGERCQTDEHHHCHCDCDKHKC